MSRLTNPEGEPSVSCGFFNSKDHDRRYNSRQISSMFDGVIKDGVFLTIGDCFNPVPSIEMENVISIGTGKAWFDHSYTKNDAPLPIECNPPELILSRIDAIVIETNDDPAVRDNFIKYIAGTPASNPVRPAMIKSTLVNHYPICYIRRKPNVSIITDADITKMVGSEETPFVTGVADSPDFTQMLTQWRSELDQFLVEKTNEVDEFISENTTSFGNWYAGIKDMAKDIIKELANYRDTTETEMNDWIVTAQQNYEEEFFTWFENLKDNVTDNSESNLQDQIGNLKLLETGTKDDLVKAINWIVDALMEPPDYIKYPIRITYIPDVPNEYYNKTYRKDNYVQIPFSGDGHFLIKIPTQNIVTSFKLTGGITGFTNQELIMSYGDVLDSESEDVLDSESENVVGSDKMYIETDRKIKVYSVASNGDREEISNQKDQEILLLSDPSIVKTIPISEINLGSNSSNIVDHYEVELPIHNHLGENDYPNDNYFWFQWSFYAGSGNSEDYEMKIKSSNPEIYNEKYISSEAVPVGEKNIVWGKNNTVVKNDSYVDGKYVNSIIGENNNIHFGNCEKHVFGDGNTSSGDKSVSMIGNGLNDAYCLENALLIGRYNSPHSLTPLGYSIFRIGVGNKYDPLTAFEVDEYGNITSEKEAFFRLWNPSYNDQFGRLFKEKLMNPDYYYSSHSASRAFMGIMEGSLFDGATESINLPAGTQIMIATIEYNNTTHVFYGQHWRLYASTDHGDTAARAANTVIAAGTSAVGVTFALTNTTDLSSRNILTMKASANIHVEYRIFSVVATDTGWYTMDNPWE